MNRVVLTHAGAGLVNYSHSISSDVQVLQCHRVRLVSIFWGLEFNLNITKIQHSQSINNKIKEGSCSHWGRTINNYLLNLHTKTICDLRLWSLKLTFYSTLCCIQVQVLKIWTRVWLDDIVGLEYIARNRVAIVYKSSPCMCQQFTVLKILQTE